MDIDADTPLWLAARAIMSVRRKEFFRCWLELRKGFDPEPIHDLRVASRRFREGLDLFAPCYPAKPLARVTRRVKGVTRLLGDVRNTDEAILYFSSLAGKLDGPAAGPLATLVDRLRQEREREAERLRSALDSLSVKALRSGFGKTLTSPLLFSLPPGGIDPFATIGSFARQSLDARLLLVRELLPKARNEADCAAQHQLRIAIKHFRYRFELLSFLMGRGAAETIANLKQYQDLIGWLHDRDVFADLVRGRGFPPDVAHLLLSAIATERHGIFGQFRELLAECPLETNSPLVPSPSGRRWPKAG